MVTTVQVTTARSERAFQEGLLASEAGRVEFTQKNSEQTEVKFKMSALRAFELVEKVMARVAAAHGKRGYPHQSIHYLRTRVFWQLSDEEKQLRNERKQHADSKPRQTRRDPRKEP